MGEGAEVPLLHLEKNNPLCSDCWPGRVARRPEVPWPSFVWQQW